MATAKSNHTANSTPKPAFSPKSPKKRRWPRGIRAEKRFDRGGQWQVCWVERDGMTRKRRAKLFPTQEQAFAYADDLTKAVNENGRQVLSFDPRAFSEWQSFKEELEGASLSEVLAVWREHLIKRRRAAIQLKAAVEEHCELLQQEGVTGGHFAHVELHLARLIHFFGENTPIGNVTTEGIREWLASLGDEGDGGDGFGPATIKHHLKSIRAFFNRAVAEHWIHDTPADPKRVKGPKVVEKEKVALSIAEAKQLFAVNRNYRVCGRMALEAFAGVRYTGAIRLRREDINWKDGFLLLPAELHKSGDRHVLDNLPKNLWAWLKHADTYDGFWEMTERQYLEEKSDAFARAGIENPGNILRRSFCSWMIALHGNANRVAAMMQHRNPEMLYRQYKTCRTREGFVTQKDAAKWEKITP